MKSVLILYPHQLYDISVFPEVNSIIVTEDRSIFGIDADNQYRVHKQKIILLRSAARRYAEEVLWPAGYKVDYIGLDVLMQPIDLLRKAGKFDKVYMFDPLDNTITEGLLSARRELKDRAPEIEFLSSPNFYLKEHEVRQYFAQSATQTFNDFYQWQRERFNILITDDYKSEGGSWQLSPGTSSESTSPAGMQAYGDNKWVAESISYVEKHFPDNPGSTTFIWPTSKIEAEQWLKEFIKTRLSSYGLRNYKVDNTVAWYQNSAISPLLNIGLLDPVKVVELVIEYYAENKHQLPQVEHFIRQILGWREFSRAIYLMGDNKDQLAKLKSDRRLTADWYQGTTGLLPFDSMVGKLKSNGYVNQSERLYIAGTLMTLCGISTAEIHRWFTEMLIDSTDWALVPNLNLLKQFNRGPLLDQGVYLATSKFILDHSNFIKGEWCDIWDGLYWNFIEENKTELSKYTRTRTIVQRMTRLNKDKRRIINYRAQDFLAKFTK